MWFLLCTPVELGLLFLSLYRAEVVENGSQTPQEHRKETQGDWEGHLTTPVTLYVHEQLPLQSGQIAKAFQEQLAAKTRSGRNTGLEVRENREQILHCSLPPWFVAPWHCPPSSKTVPGSGPHHRALSVRKKPMLEVAARRTIASHFPVQYVTKDCCKVWPPDSFVCKSTGPFPSNSFRSHCLVGNKQGEQRWVGTPEEGLNIAGQL